MLRIFLIAIFTFWLNWFHKFIILIFIFSIFAETVSNWYNILERIIGKWNIFIAKNCFVWRGNFNILFELLIVFLLFNYLLKTFEWWIRILLIYYLAIIIKLILLNELIFYIAILKILNRNFLIDVYQFFIWNLVLPLYYFFILLISEIIWIFTFSFQVNKWRYFIIFINELKICLNFFLIIIFIDKLILNIFFVRF